MRLLLGAVAAVVLAGPVGAAVSTPVTIKPGDYKLEWRTQVPLGQRTLAPARDFRSMSAAEVTTCPGLVSKDARITDGPLRLVIDESGGTGSGYDTLYYIPAGQNADSLDFGRAVKMALKQTGKDPIVLKTTEFPAILDWPVGEGESRVLKQVKFDYLQAIFVRSGENGSRRVTLGALTLSGGWFGKVDTDRGPMMLALEDRNCNGLYGEKVRREPESDSTKVGDVIVLGDKESTFTVISRSLHSMYPGEAVSYDGKLYTVKVSRCGDTVSIRPYQGDTGRLAVETVDSRGNPTQCFATYARGTDSVYGVHGCFGSDLPVGRYKLTRFLIGPDHLNATDGKFRFYQYRDCEITVEKGKTATIRLGGPIAIDIRIESKTRIVPVKRGQMLEMCIFPMIGKDRIEMVDDRTVSITVKDPSGKVVHAAAPKQTFHDTDYSTFDYSLPVSRDWKPGLYTLTATLDGRPYQEQIVGARMLNVTP